MAEPLKGAATGLELRALVKALFGLVEPVAGATDLLVTVSPFASEPQPPQGSTVMAQGNVGEYALITISFQGELSEEPELDVDDDAVAEVVEISDKSYVHLLSQGATLLRATATNPAGLELESVTSIVSNDPADDATIIEMEIGAFSPDVPT